MGLVRLLLLLGLLLNSEAARTNPPGGHVTRSKPRTIPQHVFGVRSVPTYYAEEEHMQHVKCIGGNNVTFCIPATRCGCHAGVVHCNGVVKTHHYQERVGPSCVVIPRHLCWWEVPVPECHDPPNPWQSELLLLSKLQLALIVLVILLITIPCLVIRGRLKWRLRTGGWCNCLALLLVLLMNMRKSNAAVMQIGSCDSQGACLREVYYHGRCDLEGKSFSPLSVEWKHMAWCSGHDCCKEGGYTMDEFKCITGTYNWASGCFAIHHGCHVCGFKLHGEPRPIYHMQKGKLVCKMVKGDKIYPVNCGADEKELRVSPVDQCLSNTPQVSTQGVYNYKGIFECDCPDPHHCSAQGKIEFEEICTEQVKVEESGGWCKVHTDKSVEVNPITCGEGPPFKPPCEKNGKICWDTNCTALSNTQTTSSTIMDWWHGFEGTVFDWCSPFYGPWVNWVPYILCALLFLLLILKR